MRQPSVFPVIPARVTDPGPQQASAAIAYARAVQALKPGGVFILEAYTPRQLEMDGVGGPPDRSLLMSLEDLRTELEGLNFIIGREVERYISEGRYHRGNSAVVQIVARKP